MKSALLILLLASLAGCVTTQTGERRTSNAERPTSNGGQIALPPMPAIVQSPMSQAQSQGVVLPPPAVAPLWFHFDFTVTAVESSTDLVHWVQRDDAVLRTNITDTGTNVFWNLPRDPSKRMEFYRAGGLN